jgi:hypothetical protein
MRLVLSGTPASSFTISSSFLPGHRGAVLRHVQLGVGLDLPPGRCERSGHRQDHADLHDLLRQRGTCDSQAESCGNERPHDSSCGHGFLLGFYGVQQISIFACKPDRG